MPNLPPVHRSPFQKENVINSGQRDTNTEEQRKFYALHRWRKTSERHRRDEPLCRECEKVNRYVAATLTDHIRPMSQGGDPWDESNLQSLCSPCHNRKRQSERGA